MGLSDEPLRVLVIDHHDSYTLNLLISITEASKCTPSVVILAHDHALLATIDSFRQHLLPHFDAIILGPGPGHPSNEEDFGPARRILSAVLEETIRIPILGICLGHQGIAAACGVKIIQADSLRHGLSSTISLSHLKSEELAFSDLFDGIRRTSSDADLHVIRYNSLTVDESTLPPELVVTAWAEDPSCSSPPPVQNAYFPSADPNATASMSSIQRVVMGLQHRSLPLWGVQFHPESISSQGGPAIFRQFLHNCKDFWSKPLSAGHSEPFKCQARDRLEARRSSPCLPTWVQKLGTPLVASSSLKVALPPRKEKRFRVVTRPLACSTSYDSACTVYGRLFKSKTSTAPSVWLDSARRGDPQSCYSYMSLPTWFLSYDVDDKNVQLHRCSGDRDSAIASFDLGASSSSVETVHGLVTPKASRPNSPSNDTLDYQNGFWTWLSAVQSDLQESLLTEGDEAGCPFKTGFVGYFDYEMKSESLKRGKGISKAARKQTRTTPAVPSAWWGFCDKLLAYDHHRDEWAAVALVRSDDGKLEGKEIGQVQKALEREGMHIGISNAEADKWISEVEFTLKDVARQGEEDSKVRYPFLPQLLPCDSSSVYKEKAEAARAYIAKGESYEICLTNQFKGELSEEEGDTEQDYSYSLYKSLRVKNPAPYSAFLDLGMGKSVLSTSPERFMNIEEDGVVEMRPIKGTLARAGYRPGEEEYRRGKDRSDEASSLWCQAEDDKRRKVLECDPKERAENLMIVDLIRADLLSFCSPESVKVPRLMKVESYESVHQLVTTITGQKDSCIAPIQALQRCFPPGSMTGAPKVRSVDILDRLEGRPRGVYSGILGWIGLNGAASTSVVIRTIVVNGRQLSVGAGGAITYLSDAEKEWQEVLDKLSSIVVK